MSCSDSESDGENSPQKSPPKFTVTLAPPITLANRDAYKIVGTCTVKDKRITVVVGDIGSCQYPLRPRLAVAGGNQCLGSQCG